MMTDQVLTNIIPAIFATITTIIGAFFGFILSEVSARRREAQNEKKQAQSVRLIISLEVIRNLDALKTFWAAVKTHDYDSQDHDRHARDMARQFVDTPLLPFSRDSLTSQLPLLALALPYDTISKVFQLYDKLGKLETLRGDLISASQDQSQENARFQASLSRSSEPGAMVFAPRKPFDEKAAQVWDEIEGLVTKLQAEGNPIK